MTDLFDQQITDGLHRTAARIGVPRGSFGDVRRRVRARRGRHLAAAVVPAVAGMAWIGMRPSGDPSQLSAGATTDSTTGSSDPSPDSAVTSTTTTENTSTLPPDLVDGVLCLDATGQSDGLLAGCLEYLPNARMMKAPSAIIIAGTPMFLVPLAPIYQAEAQALSDRFGLPVRPDVTAHLQQDLAGTDLSDVRVFMVIGTTDPTTCTIPGCDSPATTYVRAADEAWADRVARSSAVFEALGFPAGERTTGPENDAVQVAAADPARPYERQISLTILYGVPEVVTQTTVSWVEHEGSVLVLRQATDGWVYELEVTDSAGGPLPTGDEMLQLLVTTYG
jgi:hypothetical protein